MVEKRWTAQGVAVLQWGTRSKLAGGWAGTAPQTGKCEACVRLQRERADWRTAAGRVTSSAAAAAEAAVVESVGVNDSNAAVPCGSEVGERANPAASARGSDESVPMRASLLSVDSNFFGSPVDTF